MSGRAGRVTFDWQKVTESKDAYRRKLAAAPIAEKLRMLDADARARTCDTQRDRHQNNASRRTAAQLRRIESKEAMSNSQLVWLEKLRDCISARGSERVKAFGVALGSP